MRGYVRSVRLFMQRLAEMDDYSFTREETDFISESAGMDLMTNSELRASVMLMAKEINRLVELKDNLEHALEREMELNKNIKTINERKN